MTKATRKNVSWSGVSGFVDIPETETDDINTEIDIDLIEVTTQNRKYFDEDKLNALAQNIKQHGVLSPIIVRTHPTDSSKYQLIAGERRLRAAKIAELTTIPAQIRECDDKGARNIQLWENLNREQLNIWEETRAIMDILISILDMSQEKVISLLGHVTNAKDGKIMYNVVHNSEVELLQDFFAQAPITCESYRIHRLPLLFLQPDILEYAESGKIECSKLLVIKKLKDEATRASLLQKTFDEKLSLTQVKELVALQLESEKPSRIPTIIDKYAQIVGRLRKMDKKISPKSRKVIEKNINTIEQILNELENAESEAVYANNDSKS